MKTTIHLAILTAIAGLFFLTACLSELSNVAYQSDDPIDANQPIDESILLQSVWEALEPNTSSRERSNWQVLEARLSSGSEVKDFFAGEPAPGCWMGPEPPANEEIAANGKYWFISMQPLPATQEPSLEMSSPTSPPLIPEPFLREAYFLVDQGSGKIIARKLFCVVY